MATTSWKTIAADLEDRIQNGELIVGARLPSGDQIAENWGVSRHTAHRAIEELQRRGMVVRQRRWGTVVAHQTTKRIGRVALLVDELSQVHNFPSGELIRGIQDALGEEVDLVLAESKGDTDVEIRQLRKFQGHVDGLILYPTLKPKSTPVIQKFIETGQPLVILDRVPEGVRTDAVTSDNLGATKEAVETLIKRGHRRIGFFSFRKPEFSSVMERCEGFHEALAEGGVEDIAQHTRWFPRELESNPEGFVQAVYDSLFTLVHRPEPITALFCVQDSVASAVCQVVDQMELSLLDDLELATFNDWPSMMLRSPWAIHRIVQRSYDIGHQAAMLLGERIKNGPDEPRLVRIHADFFPAAAMRQTAK